VYLSRKKFVFIKKAREPNLCEPKFDECEPSSHIFSMNFDSWFTFFHSSQITATCSASQKVKSSQVKVLTFFKTEKIQSHDLTFPLKKMTFVTSLQIIPAPVFCYPC
jgi:hypothetical protein